MVWKVMWGTDFFHFLFSLFRPVPHCQHLSAFGLPGRCWAASANLQSVRSALGLWKLPGFSSFLTQFWPSFDPWRSNLQGKNHEKPADFWFFSGQILMSDYIRLNFLELVGPLEFNIGPICTMAGSIRIWWRTFGGGLWQFWDLVTSATLMGGHGLVDAVFWAERHDS